MNTALATYAADRDSYLANEAALLAAESALAAEMDAAARALPTWLDSEADEGERLAGERDW